MASGTYARMVHNSAQRFPLVTNGGMVRKSEKMPFGGFRNSLSAGNNIYLEENWHVDSILKSRTHQLFKNCPLLAKSGSYVGSKKRCLFAKIWLITIMIAIIRSHRHESPRIFISSKFHKNFRISIFSQHSGGEAGDSETTVWSSTESNTLAKFDCIMIWSIKM